MSEAQRRFDAVLFDFGGVLSESPFHALRDAAIAGGNDPDLLLDVMFGPYHEDTDHPWHRVERGEITLEVFLTDVGVIAKERGTVVDWSVLAAIGSSMTIRDHMVELALDVKRAGYGLGLITNNIAESRAHWEVLIPIDEFDVVIDSSSAGIRKPNAAIYHLALEQLGGIAPDRAIMVDDAEGNIVGARAAGLEAVHVDDPHLAEKELRTLLGL